MKPCQAKKHRLHKMLMEVGTFATYVSFLTQRRKFWKNTLEAWKRYKCDQCNYEGNQRTILVSHIRSNYSNLWNNHEECEFKASQRGNLKAYNRKMYEGIVFGCNQCEHEAKTKFHLNVHMQSQHEVYRFYVTTKRQRKEIWMCTNRRSTKEFNIIVIRVLSNLIATNAMWVQSNTKVQSENACSVETRRVHV